MKPVSKATLQLVTEEFPSFRWADSDLEELVAPKFGIITDLRRFFEEVEAVATLDLADTGMAGAMREHPARK